MARTVSVTPTTAIGRALEKHRIAAGWTRQEVAAEAGTSVAQYLRWLTMTREFSPMPLVKAARALRWNPIEAMKLIGVVVVPPDVRVVRTAEKVDHDVVEDMRRVGLLAVPPGTRTLDWEEVVGFDEPRLQAG